MIADKNKIPTKQPWTPETEAERRLEAGAAADGMVELGPDLPVTPTDDTRIRAAFLRDLLLRDPAVIDPRGLLLQGAWVEGYFDLRGLEIKTRLRFSQCRFDATIGLIDARLRAFHLPGCHISGLEAENARFEGNLILNREFIAEEGIDLRHAHIAGDIDLDSAELRWRLDQGRGPVCLNLERANIGGSLTMRVGFAAHGDIRLYDANIGTNLEIHEAYVGALAEEGKRAPDAHEDDPLTRIRSALDLEKATIGGALLIAGKVTIFGAIRLFSARLGLLELKNDVTVTVPKPGPEDGDWAPALNADFCKIDGFTFIDDSTWLEGDVTFFHASTGVFAMAPGAVPEGRLRLDGLKYDRLGDAGTSDGLVAFLNGQHPNHLDPFRPQPWVQCAAVLDSMGHDDEATEIRIAMERRHRQSIRNSLSFPRSALQTAGDWLLDQTVRFGYRPMRAGYWALLFLAAGWAAAAVFSGSFVAAKTGVPEFHALAFATDSFVPVLKLGMADAYRAADDYDALRLGVWIYQILGWVLAGFWVAGLTGITKK